jgi:hypothetical protein
VRVDLRLAFIVGVRGWVGGTAVNGVGWQLVCAESGGPRR